VNKSLAVGLVIGAVSQDDGRGCRVSNAALPPARKSSAPKS